MTMLEATDADRRSYSGIAEVIESVSARTTQELRQLWRRVVFSVLISNTDDHLRNHGFLHEAGDVWRLAPAFDLNPDPSPGPKYLSTAIGLDDETASVSAALAVAEQLRLDESEATAILREVTDAIATWQTVATAHGLSGREISGMAPAFAAAQS